MDLDSRAVRRYLIGKTNALQGYVEPSRLFSSYASGKDTSSASPAEVTTRLRCKQCRHDLAVAPHVLRHEPGKGETAFDYHRRDQGHKPSDSLMTNSVRDAHPALTPVLARIRAGIVAKTTQAPLLPSAQCTAYFVEPLKWMIESSGLVEGVQSGRILCPSAHCKAKLGSWSWTGFQCAW